MRSTGLLRHSWNVDRDARNGAAGIEELSERIATLAAERQELRKAGASCEVLEVNRVQLGRGQWALSEALIEKYLPCHASV
jgi:hypothetical protein